MKSNQSTSALGTDQKDISTLRIYEVTSTGESKYTFIFFPSSGYLRERYLSFFQKLSKLGTVYVVEEGYFGLSLSDPSDLHKYSSSSFCLQLSAYLERKRIGPVILVGSSAGAVLATKFTVRYPALVSRTILVSVPFCAPFYNNFLLFWLNVGLATKPESVLGFFEWIGSFRSGWSEIVRLLQHVKKRSGLVPALLCYKEIALFVKYSLSTIPALGKEKVFLFVGKEDPVYQCFSDKSFIDQQNTQYLACTHNPMVALPDELIRRISTISSQV